MTSVEGNAVTNNDEEITISSGQELELAQPVIELAPQPPLPPPSPPPPPPPVLQNEQNQERHEHMILTQSDGGETNSTCMICMEEWTIGSEHRLCCLKCGHLFGRSCIERWIKEKGQQAKCPSCNKATKKIDIRDLWCKAIKASDSTELNELHKLLEQERKQRKADSAIIFHQNLRIDLLHTEIGNLKRNLTDSENKISKLQSVINRMNQLMNQKMASTDGCGATGDVSELERSALQNDEVIAIDIDVQPRELKGMFHFAEKVESSSTGGCRSFALCPTSSIILVAQPTPSSSHAANVFGGYGLRKYSTLDTKVREFIPLHSKIITSIQLKPIGDLILTSGQDKKVKLTSINNNTCVQSYQTQYEPTCVAWSLHRDQQFYVGSGNCFVTLYDIRNTSDYVYQTHQRVANTRLLSIAPVSSSQQNGAALNGLLVNDSKGCQFLEISDSSDYESETIDRGIEHLDRHQMPFDGLMGTVDFHKPTGLSLISTRHSQHSPNATHNLVRLKQVQDDQTRGKKIDCERVKTFFSNRAELLSQSKILKHPTLSDHVLVGACDDSAKGIKLWDASDNTEYQSIRTDVFIRDMIMYTPENTNQHILYTLSEKGMNIYRWDYA